MTELLLAIYLIVYVFFILIFLGWVAWIESKNKHDNGGQS